MGGAKETKAEDKVMGTPGDLGQGRDGLDEAVTSGAGDQLGQGVKGILKYASVIMQKSIDGEGGYRASTKFRNRADLDLARTGPG